MEKSKHFDRVKRFYEQGLWTKQQVHDVVGTAITEEEYEIITGEPYET